MLERKPDQNRLGVFVFTTRALAWATGHPKRQATLQAVSFALLFVPTSLLFGLNLGTAVLTAALSSVFFWLGMWALNRYQW